MHFSSCTHTWGAVRGNLWQMQRGKWKHWCISGGGTCQSCTHCAQPRGQLFLQVNCLPPPPKRPVYECSVPWRHLVTSSVPRCWLSLPPPPPHSEPTRTADRVHSIWPPAVWPQMGGFLSESFPDVKGLPPYSFTVFLLFPSPWVFVSVPDHQSLPWESSKGFSDFYSLFLPSPHIFLNSSFHIFFH